MSPKSPDAYTSDDLAYLWDVDERCRDLGDAEIIELANRVNRARLSGKAMDDPGLRLDIQRAFQNKRLHVVTDLSVANDELRNVRDDLKAETTRGDTTREALITERRKVILEEARNVFKRNVIWSVLVGCAWIAGNVLVVLRAFRGNTTWQVVFSVLSLGGPAEMYAWISGARAAFRQTRDGARSAAESQIAAELAKTLQH